MNASVLRAFGVDRVERRRGVTPSSKAGDTIYFIEGAGLVKIGITNDVQRRFDELRAMSPVPLRLVLRFPGDHGLEAGLHARFAGARRHGEWFLVNEEIAAFVEAMRGTR